MTFTLMATVAFICMLVPVFCIREKDYVDTVPAKESAFRSLVATFKNGEFRKFVGSDIFYWIARIAPTLPNAGINTPQIIGAR